MENMQFVPMEFVKNLKYMGVGLVGVFLIIGIIIASSYGISYFTAKLSGKGNNEEEK